MTPFPLGSVWNTPISDALYKVYDVVNGPMTQQFDVQTIYAKDFHPINILTLIQGCFIHALYIHVIHTTHLNRPIEHI